MHADIAANACGRCRGRRVAPAIAHGAECLAVLCLVSARLARRAGQLCTQALIHPGVAWSAVVHASEHLILPWCAVGAISGALFAEPARLTFVSTSTVTGAEVSAWAVIARKRSLWTVSAGIARLAS